MPTIQNRRGTASQWATANPVLAAGELGYETDTNRFKIGNGSQNWNSLSYTSGLQGVQGTFGPQGIQGFIGLQGVQGNLGLQGGVGPQGIQGITGAQGLTGIQGAFGVQGTTGAGLTGSQGTQGIQGSLGGPGSQGVQGLNGAFAAQGIAGAQGTQGIQGVTGVPDVANYSPTFSGGNYNLISTDRDKMLEVTNGSSSGTVTVPLNSTVPFSIGTQINLTQIGTGSIFISWESGVTVNSAAGFRLRTQWSTATLYKRGTNTWLLFGDLSA